ncbi:hypothetical protein BLA29_001555 [Euroglyphus maynei]|uniref:Uncharacterized protein n=1 Tax=Euroglyphus maynei TaxID=6958 RepID=A0A1Y3AQL8_EURMA|nr:hypothetical protein BLA29_001555 [Euroglyphus maynei]
MLNILLQLIILATFVWATSNNNDIDNLQVFGDFRSIKLKWNYHNDHHNDRADGPRFKIR